LHRHRTGKTIKSRFMIIPFLFLNIFTSVCFGN
jgi:hypothetical protein